MSSNQRTKPWESKERHYCPVCNAWMGSDRQSILIHTQGKKHRENVEADGIQRRKEKMQKQKEQDMVARTLQIMNEAVSPSQPSRSSSTIDWNPARVTTTTTPSNKSGGNNMKSNGHNVAMHLDVAKKEKEEERVRERGREDSKHASRTKDSINSQQEETKKRKLQLLSDQEGHYTVGEKTYLDASIFGALLEKDMMVEIFTGSSTMSKEFQQSIDAENLWKTGIILQVHKNKKHSSKTLEDNHLLDPLFFDVSYLNAPTDEDETIERTVGTERLRILLGCSDLKPSTVEEARLALLGGEEIVHLQNDDSVLPEIDENTGLSRWGTVSIKKTTLCHEVKQDREREKAKKREEAEYQRLKVKEMEIRRMEETTLMHVDDSALGAYDVYNSGKGGYKGVQIYDESKSVPLNKSLNSGVSNVGFKTIDGANMKKKQIRKIRLDDDDDD